MKLYLVRHVHYPVNFPEEDSKEGRVQLLKIRNLFKDAGLSPTNTEILTSTATKSVITALGIRGAIGEFTPLDTARWLGEQINPELWKQAEPYILKPKKNYVIVDHQHNIEGLIVRLAPMYIHNYPKNGDVYIIDSETHVLERLLPVPTKLNPDQLS